MSDDRQFLFPIPKLNRWFALASFALLFSIVWLVWDDYSREWKRHQRDFRALEISKTAERIEAEEQAVDPEQRRQLADGLASARAAIDRKEDEIRQVQGELDALDARDFRATQAFRFTKAELSQAEFYLNEALKAEDEDQIATREEQTAELGDRLAEFDDRVKTIAAERTALDSRKAAVTGEADRIQSEWNRLYADRDRLRQKLQAIDYTLPNLIRNLPILDFMNPSLRVEQQVVNDVLIDISFMQIPKVDRCISCHLGIDRPELRRPVIQYRSDRGGEV